MANTTIPLELSAYAPTSSGATLELQTTDTTVTDGSVLGKIEFKAPSEASGTDAILVGAAIEAVAEGTFAADNNATELLFKTGVSEAAATKMVLTSAGKLGIGDTSPFAKLHVEDTGWSSGAPYGTVVYIQGGATNDANWGHLLLSQSGTTTDTGGRLAFGANGENPIAGIRAKYKGATYGDLAFSTRPSGGTNTERMVIDSSGEVGIGTTSPSARLHVKSAGTGNVLYIESSDGHHLGGFYQESDTRAAFNVRNASGGVAINLDGNGDTYFNGGDVGVGTADPDDKFHVAGGVRFNTTTGDGDEPRLYFAPGGAADDPQLILYRHDGSSISTYIRPGNYVKFENSLYLTNSSARIGVMGADPSADISVQSGSNGNTTVLWRWGANASNTHAYFIDNGNDGVTMASGASSWSAHSDERTKENITDIGSVLDKVKDYRCVEFNRKTKTRKMYGFIAQDWETDFPHCVDEDTGFTIQSDGSLKDVNEEGNTSTNVPKTIAYTETIPVLLKAIQELKEENDALKARVTTLES